MGRSSATRPACGSSLRERGCIRVRQRACGPRCRPRSARETARPRRPCSSAGSAGELPSIVGAVLEKNSQVRLCVPCVTVETLTEACALLSGSRFKGFEACQVSAAPCRGCRLAPSYEGAKPRVPRQRAWCGADAEELAEVGALAESPVGEDLSVEGNPSVEVVSLANCAPQVGKAAPGEHVHPALHGRCALERERQDGRNVRAPARARAPRHCMRGLQMRPRLH